MVEHVSGIPDYLRRRLSEAERATAWAPLRDRYTRELRDQVIPVDAIDTRRLEGLSKDARVRARLLTTMTQNGSKT